MESEPAHSPAASDDGSTIGAVERWSMLPDDILSLVYSMIACAVDRVRFAAVCTSWRAIAPMHPPRRVLPWLILDPGSNDRAKHAYCLEDGAILSPFWFPSAAVGGRIVGGHDGGWVAVSEAPLRIINLFSGAEVPLSAKLTSVKPFVPLKVIFSKPPTSSGCILAAIIGRSQVAICGLGRLKSAWSPHTFVGTTVLDIALCNGHLYCLMSEKMEIVRFEVGLTENGVFKGDPQWLDIDGCLWYYFQANGDPAESNAYILELHGKIMIAVRRTRGSWWWSRNTRGPFFICLELVDHVGHGTYKWEIVKSLGDHALFLGQTFSKAMHVAMMEKPYRSPRRNHIYYSNHRCYPRKECLPGDAKEFFRSSNNDGCHVYHKEEESIDDVGEGIMSVGHYALGSGDQYPPPMWLFPPDL
ncbi:hypothetical protein ZWY2020_026186 [Hordeum vulgare]|nr:hypothetical protein ZWY2020_026186 [Hordeum vulgare]